MANSASTQLFDLIATMSRSEKRYFKIHIRTHSSKHSEDYIRLFGLIDDQEDYTEAPLIKAMDSAGCTQRFAVLKHRLFEKVLDSLEAFQRSSDTLMGLRHELNKVKTLFDRGMQKIAITMTEKVYKKALDVEAHYIAAECLQLQARAGKEDSLRESADHDMLGKKIATEYRATNLRSQLFSTLEHQGRTRTGLVIDTGLVEQELLVSAQDLSTSSRARYLSHHALSAIQFSKNEIDQSLIHLKHCEELLEEYAFLRDEFPLGIADIWANQSYIYVRRHELKIARNNLMKLLAVDIDALNGNLQLQFRGSLLQGLLFYLNQEEDFHLEERLHAELERYAIERWEYMPALRAALDYSLGVYLYSKEDRSQALKALNKILNDGEIHRDEDVYHRTLVLTTVLHIESKDKDWMAHSARALKRYLRPRNLLRGVESVLLEYISDLRRAKTEEGECRALNQFIHKLRSIRRDEIERVSFEHFDFLAWAERQAGEDHPHGLVA